ncbi:unnamed protein product [Nippostrongylus brasiliensis]|uniref:Uncharacterized protein n=1 Tax=Nippostrongylus brasiliensis TaxID=27835 RepID=A0A0N4Y6I1_NIPBR|nr:unnamed protein product [Nippostrongylus brasiliensis]
MECKTPVQKEEAKLALLAFLSEHETSELRQVTRAKARRSQIPAVMDCIMLKADQIRVQNAGQVEVKVSQDRSVLDPKETNGSHSLGVAQRRMLNDRTRPVGTNVRERPYIGNIATAATKSSNGKFYIGIIMIHQGLKI